jgi:hypothetical protein
VGSVLVPYILVRIRGILRDDDNEVSFVFTVTGPREPPFVSLYLLIALRKAKHLACWYSPTATLGNAGRSSSGHARRSSSGHARSKCLFRFLTRVEVYASSTISTRPGCALRHASYTIGPPCTAPRHLIHRVFNHSVRSVRRLSGSMLLRLLFYLSFSKG